MTESYINPKEYVIFHVTGKTVNGTRFRIECNGLFWAMGINLYTGSVWGVRPDGTRKLLKRVYN